MNFAARRGGDVQNYFKKPLAYFFIKDYHRKQSKTEINDSKECLYMAFTLQPEVTAQFVELTAQMLDVI